MPKAGVNGIDVCYRVQGEGEPLVLIMGFGGGHYAWFFQTRAFKKYYQVVTFDSRGVGKTDKPSEPYTVKTMADDAIGLMDYLGVGKAHILGVSMGGAVAQEVAISYPERVDKLILGSTYAGGEEVGEVAVEMQEALGLGDGFSREDVRSVDIMKFATCVTSLSFKKRLYRMILVPLSKRWVRSVGFDGLMGQFEASASCDTLDRLDVIEAPTLVITGTEDRVVPPRSSDVIARRIPRAKLVKVEGGSHAFHLEMSGRFNREVLSFLRGS